MVKGIKNRTRVKVSIRKKDWILTGMAFPAIALLFIFSYLPMVGLVIAFKDFKYDQGFFGSQWVGFKNFAFFFKSNDVWVVLTNTLWLNFLFITFTLVASVAVAIMLNEIASKKMIKATQTIMFFPYFMSWVVVGFLLYAFLQPEFGLVNSLLAGMGMDKIAWYTEAKYWPTIMTICYLWKMVGYYSVIYYASLMGIDSSYYEAAAIDGATKWQQICKITLPLLRPIVVIMLILQIGRIMYADFGQFFQLTRDQGALYPTTDVLDTYIFRALRATGNISVGSAVGCFQAVVGFILILSTNLMARKIDSDSALF